MRRLLQRRARRKIYRQLCAEGKQFRLLTILPGHKSTKVYCRLHTASLDDGMIPMYETISYAWGNKKHRSSIRINGAVLNVPYNTMAALRRMRSPEDERVVWIDAVCINQADLEERSTQVAVMATIYANGRENLVFLGDDEESVAGGVANVLNASLQRISVAIEGLSQEERKRLKEDGHLESLKNNTILEGLDNSQNALLYSLPWFRRLWVLQEATLAVQSRCYWGASEFMLADALLVVSALRAASKEVIEFDFFTAYLGICAAVQMYESIARLRITHAANRKESFWSVATRADVFQATDPRDHIFAPLQLYVASMGSSLIPPWLFPDYRKSVEEVFRDATQYVLVYEAEHRDSVLKEVSHRSIEDLESKLPSWVVRLDRYHFAGLDQTTFYGHRSGFRIDDDFPEPLMNHNTEEPDILELFVRKVGSMSHLIIQMPYERDEEENEENFASVQKIVAEFDALSGPGSDLHAELLTYGNMKGFRDVEHRIEGYHHFRQHVKEHGHFPDRRNDIRPASLFWRTFSGMHHRRFFRTTNGYLGWGPGLMQESDILVVAHRASVPYILRPVESGHLFLGHAWVHGLMNGEVFDLDGEWEWIRIC